MNRQPFTGYAPTPFRIQQQQVPPPPPANQNFSKPEPGSLKKEVLDAQNDDLIVRADIVRQKTNYLKGLYQQAQGFQTQSLKSSKSEDLKAVEKLERKLKGIDSARGCYDYYRNKPKYKEEEEKQAQEPKPVPVQVVPDKSETERQKEAEKKKEERYIPTVGDDLTEELTRYMVKLNEQN